MPSYWGLGFNIWILGNRIQSTAPFTPHFLNAFIIKGWIFQMLFPHQLRWSCDFFSEFCQCGLLHWLNFVYRTILAFQNKFYLLMVYNLYNMLLNFICYSVFKDFCINIQKGYWSVVSFSCHLFVFFLYQGNADIIERIRKCFLLFGFF